LAVTNNGQDPYLTGSGKTWSYQLERRGTMKYGNLTLGQVEALVNKLGGMEAVMSILRDVAEVVVTTISHITHFFTVLIDETRTVEELTAEGKYDWSNRNVTSKNFPRSKGGTGMEKDIALFHFRKTMTSEQVIAEMEKENYRPATCQELLALGIAQQELQRDFPIIALGSVCVLDGNRCVAVLYGGAVGRSLRLYWFDDDWDDVCRFGAVRK